MTHPAIDPEGPPPQAPPPPDHTSSGVNVPPARPRTRRRLRILLAEGDPIAAEVIRHRFEREGWSVLHYDTGEGAASALTEVEPDLCVVELKLPGMEGLQLLEQIRGNPRLRDVPVIVLTSLASEKMVARAFALGADDYVLKPFSLIELTARAKRRLAVGTHRASGD